MLYLVTPPYPKTSAEKAKDGKGDLENDLHYLEYYLACLKMVTAELKELCEEVDGVQHGKRYILLHFLELAFIIEDVIEQVAMCCHYQSFSMDIKCMC